MAITTIYVGVSSAGLADGSSYANRAALFSGGAWSTLITGHDFSSTGLKVFVDSGNYTCSSALNNAAYTTAAPTAANNLQMLAAPSGTLWLPPDPDWCASMPLWDATGMPVINGGSSSAIVGDSPFTLFYGLYFTGSTTSNGTGTVASATQQSTLYWCFVENSGSSTNSCAVQRTQMRFNRVVIRASGTSYWSAIYHISENPDYNQVRVEGNPAATAGNRYLYYATSGTGQTFDTTVFVGGANHTFAWTTSLAGAKANFSKCVLLNNGSNDAYYMPNVVTPTERLSFKRSVFANASTGINASTYAAELLRCLFVNNSTNTNLVNAFTDLSDLSSESLTETFVDPSNADYTQRDMRIKNTSAYWGYDIGVGDEPAPSGGSGAGASFMRIGG